MGRQSLFAAGSGQNVESKQSYQIRAKVWLYQGPAAWHFVTLTKTLSKKIERFAFGERSAWGSIRVTATVGRTSWKTSLFPDSKAGAYLLPIKADVRKKEKIDAGNTIMLTLEIRVLPGRG